MRRAGSHKAPRPLRCPARPRVRAPRGRRRYDGGVQELELTAELGVRDLEAMLEGGEVAVLRLSPSLTSADVLAVVHSMRASSLGRVFFELLAATPISDVSLWRALLEAPVDPGVAMNAAGNPGLPDDELARLLEHPDSFVQGHALLARLSRDLPSTGEEALHALLDAHAGDGGVSLGVRHMIARFGGAPLSVVRRLADDDADFIATDARRRLALESP